MSILEGMYQAVRIVGYRCNKCSKEATYEDHVLEAQEFLHWENSAGYGSIFGDGTELSLTLCQSCVRDVLGEFIQMVEPT